jgi:hypothetical protein
VILLAGDSIAVGTAAYWPQARLEAQVGIGSRAGVARIRRHGDRDVAVSLGANDVDSDVRFHARINLVLNGRRCVVWARIPSRPAHTRELEAVAAHDRRLRLVDVQPGPDGVHPTPTGYRRLARAFRRALARCRAA